MSLVERSENGENYEGEDTIIFARGTLSFPWDFIEISGEYLCVVCRRLANWLVPIVPFHLVLGKESNIVHDDYQVSCRDCRDSYKGQIERLACFHRWTDDQWHFWKTSQFQLICSHVHGNCGLCRCTFQHKKTWIWSWQGNLIIFENV